jgi:hypothetical protein
MSRTEHKVLKDPHGGLTKAGRDWFGRTQGSHLKPGVKKSRASLTPTEMRRKGSWAVRFYGRRGKLPPLRKPDGTATRYALSAAAWGEAVPRTVEQARKIAAKGRQLLEVYEKAKARGGIKVRKATTSGKGGRRR